MRFKLACEREAAAPLLAGRNKPGQLLLTARTRHGERVTASDVYHRRESRERMGAREEEEKEMQEGDGQNLPAWQRRISGPSLEGRPRRPIAGELEHLEDHKPLTYFVGDDKKKGKKSRRLSVRSPFSLPCVFFSCSAPSWISFRLSRSSLAKNWPLFRIMMDLLSMRPWNSFRRRFFSCSFTLLSTAAITSFTNRMASLRST